jgi:hypothetical protein
VWFNYGHLSFSCLCARSVRKVYRPKSSAGPLQDLDASTPSTEIVIDPGGETDPPQVILDELTHSSPSIVNPTSAIPMANFEVDPRPLVPRGFRLE